MEVNLSNGECDLKREQKVKSDKKTNICDLKSTTTQTLPELIDMLSKVSSRLCGLSNMIQSDKLKSAALGSFMLELIFLY
jgi:hypothetical protein